MNRSAWKIEGTHILCNDETWIICCELNQPNPVDVHLQRACARLQLMHGRKAS